jgi:hypothetical protein
MYINQRIAFLLIIIGFTILPITDVLAKRTKKQHQSDSPFVDIKNLGDSLQHMKNAPGRFYELPPRWSGEHNDPEYIQPDIVAENYHYNQTYRPQYHFTALHVHIGDATGLIVYKGQYHLFCMFDPW